LDIGVIFSLITLRTSGHLCRDKSLLALVQVAAMNVLVDDERVEVIAIRQNKSGKRRSVIIIRERNGASVRPCSSQKIPHRRTHPLLGHN
jgi:hypothetical protein